MPSGEGSCLNARTLLSINIKIFFYMEAGICFYRLLCLVESAKQPCQFIEFGLLEVLNYRLRGRRASDRVHA